MDQCFGLAWCGKFWRSCVWLSWYLFEMHPKDIQCHPNTKTPKFLRPRCAKYFKANNFKRKSDIPQPLMQDSVASPRLSAGYGRFPAQRQVWQLCYRTFNIFQHLSTSFNVFNTSVNLKSCAKFLPRSSVRHSNFWTILSSGFVLPFCLVLVVLGLCVPLFALRWSLNQHREALCATA